MDSLTTQMNVQVIRDGERIATALLGVHHRQNRSQCTDLRLPAVPFISEAQDAEERLRARDVALVMLNLSLSAHDPLQTWAPIFAVMHTSLHLRWPIVTIPRAAPKANIARLGSLSESMAWSPNGGISHETRQNNSRFMTQEQITAIGSFRGRLPKGPAPRAQAPR
jgi:hypothetical protein